MCTQYREILVTGTCNNVKGVKITQRDSVTHATCDGSRSPVKGVNGQINAYTYLNRSTTRQTGVHGGLQQRTSLRGQGAASLQTQPETDGGQRLGTRSRRQRTASAARTAKPGSGVRGR